MYALHDLAQACGVRIPPNATDAQIIRLAIASLQSEGTPSAELVRALAAERGHDPKPEA